MKSVLFCRVSSREQEDVGYSLPSQQKFLLEYAQRKEFSISKIFAVSESASGKSQRQAFLSMMKYIDKYNIKIIICEKTDRLTRNLKDAVSIYDWLDKDNERQLHLVKDSLVLHKNSRSQEKLNLDFRIVFAKNYIDNLSEEVKKGQIEKLEQGWLPSKPKLGYRNEVIQGKITHVPDEKYAPIIKKMFELYDIGEHSIERLTEYMYSIGLRSRDGNKVVHSRIYGFLTEPFYCGVLKWCGKEFKGSHIPLVSKEQFERVQLRLKGKNTPKIISNLFLFKALIRCGECNGLITWEKHKGFVYGHCHHYKPCSEHIWVREDRIEEQVIIALEKLQIQNMRIMEWIRRALHDSNKDVTQYHTSMFNQLSEQLKVINTRLSKLYDDKVDGIISKEFFDQKFQQYSKEKEALGDSIRQHDTSTNKYHDMGLRFYDIAQKAKDIYKKSSLDKKRLLLKLIYEKLTLSEGVVSYEYTKGFSILARLIELTNQSSKLAEIKKNDTSTFEPLRKIDTARYIGSFAFLHPDLRRRRDSNSR